MPEEFHRSEWVFESSKNVEQVLDSLRSTSLSLGGMMSQAGVRTRERGGNRVLLSYSRPFVGNSWRPMFAGVVEATPGGTRIRGRFRVSRPVAAFMTFWFGFLVLWVIGTAVAAVVQGVRGEGEWQLYLIPFFGLGMAAFGVGMTSFGRHGMGQRDEREIVSHIERQCDASLVRQPEQRSTVAVWRGLVSRPVNGFERFAAVFQPDVFRQLFTTPRGLLLLVATTAGQLPAFFAFRNGTEAVGGIIAAWLVLGAATCLGLVGLVALAESKTRLLMAIVLVQCALLAPAGFALLSMAA